METKCKFTLLGFDGICVRVNNDGNARIVSDLASHTIRIEISKDCRGKSFKQVLHHELSEGVLTLLGAEYRSNNENNYKEVFMFDHILLTTWSDVVGGAYEDICSKML